MKKLIFIFLIIASQCFAQAKFPATDTATITTAIDTLELTTYGYVAFEILVSNHDLTDTLQFRTDYETAWRDLLPSASGYRTYHINSIYAKKVFRRTRSGIVYSEI